MRYVVVFKANNTERICKAYFDSVSEAHTLYDILQRDEARDPALYTVELSYKIGHKYPIRNGRLISEESERNDNNGGGL